MKIHNVQWGIYSSAGMGAMLSSMATPAILEKEKRFLTKEDAEIHIAKLKEAATIIGCLSSFRVISKEEEIT